MRCSGCGHEINNADRFCAGCGEALSSGGDVALPLDSAQPVAAGDLRRQARPWVIVLAILISLTCFGLLIGVPLLITELKRVPVGTRPRNMGWLISGGVYALLFIIYMANMPRFIAALPSEPVAQQSSAEATPPSGPTSQASKSPVNAKPYADAVPDLPTSRPPTGKPRQRQIVPWVTVESTYLRQTATHMGAIIKANELILKHFTPPAYTDNSLWDEQWRRQLAAMLVVLDQEIQQARNETSLEPSTRLEEYHRLFQRALDEEAQVSELMAASIDQLDPKKHRAALQHIVNAQGCLQQAATELDSAQYQPVVLIDYD